MLELQTAEPTFESRHGHSEPDDRAPKSGLDRWWETPALLPPPPPNPAIYGIDAAEVAIGGLHVGSGSTVVDEVAAQVGDREGPSNLNAMIGMSNVASAQTGPARLDRATHMKKADAGRAHAMQNQLLIASRNIDALTRRIYDTISLASSKPDERGAAGYVQQLEGIVAEGEKERGRIVLVMKEKFADSAVRDGVEHIDRAVGRFKLAIEKAKLFARQNGAKFDHEKHNADGEEGDVLRLEHELKLTGIDTSHVKDVTETESKLQNESFSESLDGLDHSTRALVLAIREPDAKTSMTAVLPGLLSNTRMLEASMTSVKTSNAHRKTGVRILDAMKDAMLDASGLKLDKEPTLVHANASVSAAISKLQTYRERSDEVDRDHRAGRMWRRTNASTCPDNQPRTDLSTGSRARADAGARLSQSNSAAMVRRGGKRASRDLQVRL